MNKTLTDSRASIDSKTECSRLVLLLGGTFDPVHRGHLHLLKETQKLVKAELIVLIPCGNPPHKNWTISDACHRLQMLQRGAKEFGLEAEFDLSEINKATPSYTVDTLKTLKSAQFENDHLLWLIGMDSFNTMHQWYRWQEIFDYASVVVVDRPGESIRQSGGISEFVAERFTERNDLRNFHCGRLCEINVEALAVSSSEIREKLKKGEDVNDALTPEVLNYITEQGLYSQAASK